MRRMATLALLAVAFFITAAPAEEKFGVKVYDGATYDSDVSQYVSKIGSAEAACYATKAPLGQVNEFYKKQPGVTVLSTLSTGGLFTKDNINITTQNPWSDVPRKQHRTDTLLCIVKVR